VLALSEDVWSEHPDPRGPIVVVLAPPSVEALARRGIRHRLVIDDIDAVAAEERCRLGRRLPNATASDWFADYRDVDEVGVYMAELRDQHPGLARLRSLGTSLEGQPLRALEISRGGDIRIVLSGGQHAREWIAVMVPLCIAERLLNGQDASPRIRAILDSVSFVVVPVANPDGYRHSWRVDRYWRKNRRGGYGVDLNRNYGVAWGRAGSSADRSSPNYRGEHAFSEPETRAMRDLFETEKVRAHVDFHSFSQLILYPWSHTRDDPPDRDEFAAIADRMSSAMFAPHGVKYGIRPGSDLTIGASGTLGDWVYGEHAVLAFTIELRPASGSGGGFVLPPEQIVPTCKEGLGGVLELAEWMIRDASAPGAGTGGPARD